MPVEVTARVVEIGGRRLCPATPSSSNPHKEVEQYLRNLTDGDELTGLLIRLCFITEINAMRRSVLLCG